MQKVVDFLVANECPRNLRMQIVSWYLGLLPTQHTNCVIECPLGKLLTRRLLTKERARPQDTLPRGPPRS